MKDVYQTITDHIIGGLDAAGKWKPCWRGMRSPRPTNVISDHAYQGVNILTCWVSQMLHDYPTQQWATYKQWQSVDAQVKKGARGTPILFYKQLNSEDPADDGKVIVRSSYVFNAAQVEGWTPDAEDIHQLSEADRIVLVEDWLARVRREAVIEETAEGAAYYRPSKDRIVMPRFTQFDTPAHYYGVMFHELTHWTGAKHRLDREFRRERSEYAKEELVAELGAAFLTADFGIGEITRADHVSYLANWLKALRNDKRLIVRAASLASKAVDYLHNAAAADQLEKAA